MKKTYLINIKIGEQNIFSLETKEKEVKEWEEAYNANPEAEEFKVYLKRKDLDCYSLIHSTYKRKIGF